MSDKRVNWLKKRKAKVRKRAEARESERKKKKKRQKDNSLARLRSELIQRVVERDIREEQLRSHIGPYPPPPYWRYPDINYPPFSWWQEKQEKVDWKKEGF